MESMPAGQRLSWMREGVFGNWLPPLPSTKSEALTVRTSLPSMEKVMWSGCQSICKWEAAYQWEVSKVRVEASKVRVEAEERVETYRVRMVVLKGVREVLLGCAVGGVG